MAEKHKEIKSLVLRRHKSLEETPKQILYIIALAGASLTRTEIKKIAYELAPHLFNAELKTLKKLSEHIRILSEEELIQSSGNLLYAKQDIAWIILNNILKDWKKVKPYAEVLRDLYPISGFANYRIGRMILRREIPLAILQGEGQEFLKFRQRLYNNRWQVESFEDPILTYFENPFDPKVLARFSPDFQCQILTVLLPVKIESMRDTEDYLDFSLKLLDVYQDVIHDSDTLLYYVLLAYLLRGQLDKVRQCLDRYPLEVGTQALFTGCVAILEGNLDGGLENMDLAARKLKKRGFFSGMEGVIHHVGLLAQANYKKSEAYSKKKLETKPIHELLGAVSAFQENNLYRLDTYDIEVNITEPWQSVFAGLTQVWTEQDIFDAVIEFLLDEQDIEALEKQNQYLYSLIAWELIAHDGSEKEKEFAIQKVEKLSELTGILPFIPRIVPKPAWERTLEGLEVLTSIDTKAPEQKTARLIWLFDPESTHLQPIEQKVKKNGGWTKGRRVALKRLYEEGLDSMTEQDAEVVAALERQEYRDYYYYNRIEYEWNEEKAFKALIGHPNLFRFDNPNVVLELVEKSPELILEEKEGNFYVSFSPQIDMPGVSLIKETNTRYLVTVVSEAQYDIAQKLIASGGKFPQVAKNRLHTIVTKLAGTFIVHSSLADEAENIPNIEGLSVPHILLMPVGDGFRAEVLVKPFTTEAPYFRAGEGRENIIAEIEGERILAKRNLEEEKEKYEALINHTHVFQTIPPYKSEWELADPEDCLQLLLELEELRDTQTLVIEWPKGESLKLAGQANFSQLSLRVNKQQDWFAVKGEVQVDEDLVMDLQVLLNLMDKKDTRFIALDDGRFLALTKTFKQRLEELRGSLQESKKGLLAHPAIAHNLEDWDDWGAELKVDKAWKEQIKKLKSAQEFVAEIPPTFEADLRPYQEEGYQWLSRLAHWGVGACLADDMGLGKTLQALAVILEKAPNGPALVVAPASVVRNWKTETERFAPTLRPILMTEGNRTEIMASLEPFDLLILSYNMMQIEIEGLSIIEFSTVVLDEAQAIKNKQTKRSKAAKQLQAGFKILTTGTPVENHLGELWNLFDFLNPGLLGSQEKFNNRFTIPIERDNDLEKREHLRRLLRPFILRRRKSEVLKELPAKTEITLSVPLNEEERSFYEAIRREAVNQLVGAGAGPGQQRFQILAQIMKLRQACCHPQLVLPEADIEGSKVKLFMEVVEELLQNGHKALVFSQFVKFLKLVEKEVQAAGISYQYLDGQTPMKRREKNVNAFQSGEGDLFLISLKAGGVGLNLTAADYVIHLDPWWNPAVEDQASDRAHRIGQQRPVTVYRLVTEDTIEEKIIELHAKKRDLADSLLEGGELSAKMTSQELLELMKAQ